MDTAKQITATTRELRFITNGEATNDGAGVKLTRMLGTSELNTLDPFLLLDVFESDDNTDYIGGFPSHPHRGFETVTYLLNGRMRHKDNAGNEGVIEAGGVQWMTAGKGIIHSEMPEQENGLLHGFQLWVNLPASHKMTEPVYKEFGKSALSLESNQDGSTIKVIAGQTNQGTQGPINNHFVYPHFFDVILKTEHSFTQQIDNQDNVFIYVISGSLLVGDDKRRLDAKQLGVLQQGDQVDVVANQDAQFLFVAARPLNEPIARGGPFVMNTREQIIQAFNDFENNRF